MFLLISLPHLCYRTWNQDICFEEKASPCSEIPPQDLATNSGKPGGLSKTSVWKSQSKCSSHYEFGGGVGTETNAACLQ